MIAQSLSKRLHEVSPFTPEHGAPLQPKPGATRFQVNRIIDLVVKVACGQCNSNFFNKLQSSIDPFLESAIAGERFTLDSNLRAGLATWLYKTALLVPLTQTARVEWPRYVFDQCAAVYVRRRPPVGVRVWIGRYDLRDNFPDLVCRADVSELTYRRRGRDFIGQQVLITLGYFVAVVVFWHDQVPDDITIQAGRPADALLEIWPVRVGESVWPPNHTFTYEELSRLSNWAPA